MLGDDDLAIPEKMLDFCALRHKLIAHNVANAEVPGFRKLDVAFQEELRRAIAEGDVKAIRKAELPIRKAEKPGVDPETEVARMAKNELLFDAFAQIAAQKLRIMRTAVTSK